MCYSPVCHACIATGIRLACLRHAASVHPEPGSNSLVKRKLIALDMKVRFDKRKKIFVIRIGACSHQNKEI